MPLYSDINWSLSDSLASLTGVTSLSRPQVVKHLWDHIKANSLQDPNDKREIICDDAMKNVFGVTRLNMFTMNKMIGK
jgi:chromatin remodeling complex protein RSC6